MSLQLEGSNLRTFILNTSISIAIVAIEILVFFYVRDSSGNLTITGGVTFAEYMRTYGGMQFLFAAYVQKVVFVILLSYPVLIIVLWAKDHKRILPTLDSNSFTLSANNLTVNTLSFGMLLLFYLYVRNPAELIAHPLSFISLFYTCLPIVWAFYLYSILDLLFPISILVQLLRRNLPLALALTLLTVISTNPTVNPIHLEAVLKGWSSLLLNPTVMMSSGIAHLIGFDTQIFSPPQSVFPDFGTLKFHTGITPDCSGYEGISLIVILLLGYCYLQRSTLRVARSLILVPLAILSMFVLNSIRIVVLIAIGHFYSPDLAFSGFHSIGGWLNLLIVLVLSLLALNLIPFFQKEKISQLGRPLNTEGLTLLLPLFALIAISLFTKAFTVDFQWLYPIPIGASIWVIFYFREIIRNIYAPISLLSIGIGILVFILWVYLIPADEAQNLHFFKQIQSAPLEIALAWLLCRVIGASLVVPLVEELAFRGFMLPRLENWFKVYLIKNTLWKLLPGQIKLFSIFLALLFTSLLFGILHSEVLAGTIAGLGYGLAYISRRKVMYAIYAHGITNMLLAIDVLYFGNWSYW